MSTFAGIGLHSSKSASNIVADRGIFIAQSQYVTVRNLTVTETGGDGLYIDGYPPGYDGVPEGSANIHVADCILDRNCERLLMLEFGLRHSANRACPQTGRG